MFEIAVVVGALYGTYTASASEIPFGSQDCGCFNYEDRGCPGNELFIDIGLDKEHKVYLLNKRTLLRNCSNNSHFQGIHFKVS